MNMRDRLINTWVQPATVETEWYGPKGHQIRAWHVERFIWRTEDIPLYRVAMAETLATPMTDTVRLRLNTLATRTLEYVPTGRIMYDNTRAHTEAVLFEYCLKQARENGVPSTTTSPKEKK